MAIFIALFFQVLFVFFAMAINVGLVVHDKINLQSAADLAAYYGAGKQAEILNQIAHINYQLRQNFKLLTFRYRGIGTLGSPGHPLNANQPQTFGDQTQPLPVGVCVAHPIWQEYRDFDPNASFCERVTDIPRIPDIIPSGGFFDQLAGVVADVANLRNQLLDDCQRNSVLNFNFAARILAAYRSEGQVRKEMILRLAQLLAQTGDITDLANGSVSQGAQRTLENNLTVGNRNGVTFQFFNSLGAGGCSDQTVWLPEVAINPVLFFQDFVSPGDGRCLRNNSDARPKPNRQFEDGGTNLPDGAGPNGFEIDPALESHWQGEPSDVTARSTLGYEKNPWCMAYVGVRATTQLRKIFSPIAGSRPVTVAAFAKPFGGRIGPWYGSTWEADATRSTGPKTDPLVPTREGDQPVEAEVDIVNFSQFPGDENGFGSPFGIASMATDRTRDILQGDRRMQLDHYFHIGSPQASRENGDALARDNSDETQRLGLPAVQRELELAAIAPDAFDIAYYSIEPAYYFNYFGVNTYANSPILPAESRVYDFGSTKQGTPEEESFSVQNQVAAAEAVYTGSPTQALDQFKVRDWKHLLTGWAQKGAVDYDYPDERVGICDDVAPDASFPIPGNCESGGRVGYSVKLISKGYLQRGDLPLGGEGTSGPIRNLPPAQFLGP